MTDDLSSRQKIRQAALQGAVYLEHSLASPLMQTDDLSPGNGMSAQDVAVLAGRARQAEVETTDRVIRNARLFAEYITSGLDAEDAARVWPFPVQDEPGQP